MKETLFWRAESPGGCAAVISLSGGLFRQVRLTEGMLYDLAKENLAMALSRLDWYEENAIIPEDERESELVWEQTSQETERPAQDQLEAFLEFEAYFFDNKERPLFSKIIRPGS
jgi:hypothetical protein